MRRFVRIMIEAQFLTASGILAVRQLLPADISLEYRLLVGAAGAACGLAVFRYAFGSPHLPHASDSVDS